MFFASAADVDYSATGMPSDDAPIEPSVVHTILSGSIPVMAAITKQIQSGEEELWPKGRIQLYGFQSAKRKQTPTAQSPRPPFNRTWAVKDHDDENEVGASLHDGSHRAKASTNLLDDWDSLLKASSISRSAELMDFVKAFFLTSGFPTPRMIVNLSEHLILRLIQDAANQDSSDPEIFSPQTIREEIAIFEAVLIAKQFVEAERQVDAALSTSNKGDNGFGTLDNATLIALGKLGVGANSTKVLQTSNCDRVKPQDIRTLYKKASIGDFFALPYNLIVSSDVHNILLMDTNLSKKDGKQRITYFDICANDFISNWLPPEAVGGVSDHITEDFRLNTDPTKKDVISLMSNINKAFSKTRFFRSKDQWMVTWMRILPALLSSGQWSLVAWLVHADHICRLYQQYKSSKRGSELLVTLYEDRIRYHWHTFCELGQTVILEIEAGKLNETVMDECRTKLESTLSQSGLRDSSHLHVVAPQPIYDPAAALMKQQSGMDLEKKRQAKVTHAFNQREAASIRKIRALKTSTDHHPRQYPAKGNYGKGVKGKRKSRNKGNAKNQYKRHNQNHVVDDRFKGNKSHWAKNW